MKRIAMSRVAETDLQTAMKLVQAKLLRKQGASSSYLVHYACRQGGLLFFNLEMTNVLLCWFFSYPNGKKNWVALIKVEYSPISDIYKQGLIAPIVVLFLICKGKRYYVDGINTGDISIA